MFHIDKIFFCSFLTINGPMYDESTNSTLLKNNLNNSIIEAEICEIARKCAPRVHLKSSASLWCLYRCYKICC